MSFHGASACNEKRSIVVPGSGAGSPCRSTRASSASSTATASASSSTGSNYRKTYGNIERLDLILEAEGDSPNRYRLSKQADVLMLLYLLGPSEVLHVLSGLGYSITTSVLAMLERSTAWSEFREALDTDLDDTQGVRLATASTGGRWL